MAHLVKGTQHADTGTHDEQQQLNKTHHVESRSGLRDLVQSLGEQQRSYRENVNYITFDSVCVLTFTQVSLETLSVINISYFFLSLCL